MLSLSNKKAETEIIFNFCNVIREFASREDVFHFNKDGLIYKSILIQSVKTLFSTAQHFQIRPGPQQ